MSTIVFQLEVESRRVDTIIGSGTGTPVTTPSLVRDEYSTFIIAAVPQIGQRGVQGPVGAVGPAGPVAIAVAEIPAGVSNGVNLAFTVSRNFIPNSLQVFRNGLLELIGVGYTLSSTTLTFTTAPLVTDLITVTYYITD